MELKQEGKHNWRSHIFFGGMSVVMILVVIGIYTSIGQTMIETNINFMKEMAVHDQKILMSSLENQWSILHHVPVAMEQLNPQADQEILSALSIAGDDNAGIIVEVISDKGIAFRSDGTVESDSPDYEAIKNQSGDFALVRGEEQNYLLVGTEIEPLKLGDHVFTYVVSSTPVEEMSSRLRIDSFDGEGICSVIDEKGEFLVDVSQSKEHVKRGNFFRILERAVVKEYNSVDEIKEELVDNPEGVNFRAYLDNQLFIFHMIEVEHADWYLISWVPMSVLSQETKHVFVIVTFLFVVIAAGTVGMARARISHVQKEAKSKEESKELLQEALSMAQQANRAKTVFLNNMSHDIRTPMNAIVGFVDLADKRVNDPKAVKEYLGRIKEASEHLLSLIDDILDMSRIESGKMVIQESRENLQEILGSVYGIIAPSAEKKKIRFLMDYSEVQDYAVICDGRKLSQILINLLSNAVKYTEDNGRVLFVVNQIENIGEEGFYHKGTVYHFVVEDNGIGMSEEFLGQIFDPFAREENKNTAEIKGSGLGMPIAKNLINMMGGSIQCQSEKGRGTRIEVILPLSPAGA